MKHFIWLVIFIFVAQVAIAQVRSGEIDLSSHDFSNDNGVFLAGEWEFFWHQLLTPDLPPDASSKAFISVPGSWHRQGNYPVLGFASYRLKIKLPAEQSGLSIYFPIINSSAKIWVNGKVVQKSGEVSDSPSTYKPRLQSTLIHLPEHETEVELVVQVANFSYFSGGIAGTPQINRSSAIFAERNRRNGLENFFAGSVIALCIYQLILYFLYHRGQPYLWLALTCLVVALRAMIVHGGSFLLPNLFPDVSWELWKKLEFGGVYASVILFPLYVHHLFIQHAPRKPLYFFGALAFILCGTVLFTPQFVYGKLLDFCHVGLISAFVYAVYSIRKAWKAGNDDARIILFGVLVSFPFILAEILKNSRFMPIEIEFMFLVELGVLIFLLFQVYLLAHHYAKSYQHLEDLNRNLEKLVEERSGQLITANAVKDRLLSVMSHDIKSPLNSLRGILQIYNQGSISRDQFDEYAKRIEKDLSKTSVLVENILYWTASQLKGIQVEISSVNLKLLVEENVMLLKTIAEHKNITIDNKVQHDIDVAADKNILNLVLRNLISNGIKFSFKGGVISIDAEEKHDELLIHVTDEGVGMDDDKLDTLLAPELTVSTKGTGNEKGTGLGLALCREYLEKTGGALSVDSEKGKGSVFTIKLPLRQAHVQSAKSS